MLSPIIHPIFFPVTEINGISFDTVAIISYYTVVHTAVA